MHISLLYSTSLCLHTFLFFFFNDTATTEIYTLSLHDALPISIIQQLLGNMGRPGGGIIALRGHASIQGSRSEEHTSELQSHSDLVCRLLLEKKKKKNKPIREQVDKLSYK